jgi:hypothetical protein
MSEWGELVEVFRTQKFIIQHGQWYQRVGLYGINDNSSVSLPNNMAQVVMFLTLFGSCLELICAGMSTILAMVFHNSQSLQANAIMLLS